MKLTLIDKRIESEDVKSFYWKPDQNIDWLPGQYFYYTLPKLNIEDNRGLTRQFTISSSPTEGKVIQLTTRIRKESSFKQILDQLSIGDILDAEGPNGSFILDDNLTGPQILIAGGIGITPFRSFIKYTIDKESMSGSAVTKVKSPINLIYINSNNKFVFKDELDNWQKDYDYIRVHYHNSSQHGHLDKTIIQKLIGNYLHPLGLKFVNGNFNFWLVGPPLFVTALEEILEVMHVNEENIHTEKFTGY